MPNLVAVSISVEVLLGPFCGGPPDSKRQVDYWASFIKGEAEDESSLKQTYVLDMDVLLLPINASVITSIYKPREYLIHC